MPRRFLRVLNRKDDQAQKNIGDPSVSLRVFRCRH